LFPAAAATALVPTANSTAPTHSVQRSFCIGFATQKLLSCYVTRRLYNNLNNLVQYHGPCGLLGASAITDFTVSSRLRRSASAKARINSDVKGDDVPLGVDAAPAGTDSGR
jgi:hypothetical protein